jgi:hypothetical protein
VGLQRGDERGEVAVPHAHGLLPVAAVDRPKLRADRLPEVTALVLARRLVEAVAVGGLSPERVELRVAVVAHASTPRR